MLRKISQWIVQKLEKFFAWYGGYVAQRPIIMILSCCIVTCLALIGMVGFKMENEPIRLWVPDNSDIAKNFKWLGKYL